MALRAAAREAAVAKAVVAAKAHAQQKKECDAFHAAQRAGQDATPAALRRRCARLDARPAADPARAASPPGPPAGGAARPGRRPCRGRRRRPVLP